MEISKTAKKLNEDLFEPLANEKRWEIIQEALDKYAEEAVEKALNDASWAELGPL